jgi:signal transduction histidine kinase
MMDMLKRPISESIQVSWEPSQKLWPIKVDPTQIDRVLANLCVNARYAISGNGHISIILPPHRITKLHQGTK